MKTDHAAQCCFFTAEDACRIALQAYYAALKCIEPPPGEPWMIDGDPWAGPADLADAFHGQIEARLSLLALDRLGDFLLPVSQWDVVNVAAEIAPEKMAPIIADRARANAEIDAEFLGLGLNRLPPSDNVVHNQTERGEENAI